MQLSFTFIRAFYLLEGFICLNSIGFPFDIIMASDVIFCMWRSIKLDNFEARFLGARDLTQKSDCSRCCIDIWTFDRTPGISHKSINKLTVVEKGSVPNHCFTSTCSPVTLYRYVTFRFPPITSPTNIFKQQQKYNKMSLLLFLCFIVSDFTKSSKKRFSVMYLI